MDLNDGTEIMFSSEMHSVAYLYKVKANSTHLLFQLPRDLELLKRLKYNKEILLQFIGKSNTSGVYYHIDAELNIFVVSKDWSKLLRACVTIFKAGRSSGRCINRPVQIYYR